MPENKQKNWADKIEAVFESILWNSRLIIIFAVICTLVGAVLFVGIGSIDIVKATYNTFTYWAGGDLIYTNEQLISTVIGAIDFYLIAVVLIIFGLGMYEIFISNIDTYSTTHPAAKVLEIKDLDQLKNKLGKVIVMVLIVFLFKKAVAFKMEEAIDMIYLGGSILMIAASLWLINKSDKSKDTQSN